MELYGIFDEKDNLVAEFESMEEGLKALEAMNDGEIIPYCPYGETVIQGDPLFEGYYTNHYRLESDRYYYICHGRSTLRFKDGAPVEPISKERLGIILAQNPYDEFIPLLLTLDKNKALSFYNDLIPSPIEWDPKTRTMVVDFYYLETDDAFGDIRITYNCPPFEIEN